MPIFYAFCCLCCGAVNDFLFKLFSNSDTQKSCGTFVSIVGWTMLAGYVLLGCTGLLQSPFGGNPRATLGWGLLTGFLSLTSNILLIEAMRYQSAGVCATIFRLNMVLVVLGAFLFLGEPMTVSLFVGICCALTAILAFLPGSGSDNKAQTGFYLAVLACFLRAAMSLTQNYGLHHGANPSGVAMINAQFWAFGGILFAFLRDTHFSMPTKGEWKIGMLSGIFVSGIIFFMAQMNTYGNASVVNPIAQMSFLGTFLLSCIFLDEKPTKAKFVALSAGILAIVMLCLK